MRSVLLAVLYGPVRRRFEGPSPETNWPGAILRSIWSTGLAPESTSQIQFREQDRRRSHPKIRSVWVLPVAESKEITLVSVYSGSVGTPNLGTLAIASSKPSIVADDVEELLDADD